LKPISEDENEDELDSDEVSQLSMDGLTIADTVTTGFKSTAYKNKKANAASHGEKGSSPTKRSFGNTEIGLPFVIGRMPTRRKKRKRSWWSTMMKKPLLPHLLVLL
jgi:hypothetical protein